MNPGYAQYDPGPIDPGLGVSGYPDGFLPRQGDSTLKSRSESRDPAQPSVQYALQNSGRPYPSHASAPYPSHASAPYPSQASAPYPSQASAPYASQNAAPYPSQASAPYASQNAAPYPSQTSAPYVSQNSGHPYPSQNSARYASQDYLSQNSTRYASQDYLSQNSAPYASQTSATYPTHPSAHYAPRASQSPVHNRLYSLDEAGQYAAQQQYVSQGGGQYASQGPGQYPLQPLGHLSQGQGSYSSHSANHATSRSVPPVQTRGPPHTPADHIEPSGVYGRDTTFDPGPTQYGMGHGNATLPRNYPTPNVSPRAMYRDLSFSFVPPAAPSSTATEAASGRATQMHRTPSEARASQQSAHPATAQALPRVASGNNSPPEPNEGTSPSQATSVPQTATANFVPPSQAEHAPSMYSASQTEPSLEPPASSDGHRAGRPVVFIPPLDLGPSATPEDVARMWERLSGFDHELLTHLSIEKQREEAERIRALSMPLFTVGSAGPKSNTSKTKERRRTRSRQRSQPTAASATPVMPIQEAAGVSGAKRPNGGAKPSVRFRTPYVEDASSESDDHNGDGADEDEGADEDGEEDAFEDITRIPSHAKGKGRAVGDQSPEPNIPILNTRPNSARPNQNHSSGSPFGAVLDAFHLMGERMERLELSMEQGFKKVDERMSTGVPPDLPPTTQPVRKFTGRKTKVSKTTLAHILATHNENSRVPQPPSDGSRGPPGFGHVSGRAPPFTGRVPAPTSFGQPPPVTQHNPGVRPEPPSMHAPPGFGGPYTGQPNPRPPLATTTPENPMGGGQCPQPGSHSSNPTERQLGPDMSKNEMEENIKLFRKYVRRHLWEQLLCIKSAEQLPERCPPLTDDEYQRYLRIKERVIDSTNFRIDFGRGWERSKWNVEVRGFFSRHFIASVQGGMYTNPPLPAHWVTEDMVTRILDGVMTHVFHLYKEHSQPDTTQSVAKAYRDVERKRADTRRGTLLKWRVETLVKLKLEHHLVIFQDMEAAHLSSDEPAFGNDKKQAQYNLFYIIEAAWQSHTFKTFVRNLDKWYIYFSRPKVGQKQRGGNRPRIREELPKGRARVVDSVAPRGLWRNCYDTDWLMNLKVSEREDLNMIDEDYDFTLPTPPPIPNDTYPVHSSTPFSNVRTFGSSGPSTSTEPNAQPQPFGAQSSSMPATTPNTASSIPVAGCSTSPSSSTLAGMPGQSSTPVAGPSTSN